MDTAFFRKAPEPSNETLFKDTIIQDIHSYRLSEVFPWVLALTLAFFYSRSVLKALRSPLSKIPGPWYACYTTLHLRWGFAQGTIWKRVEDEHQKRGDVLRLGPRQIWVASKEAIRDILVKTDLPKVSMYAEISRDRNSPGLFGEM